MKPLDLNWTVYDATEKYPELVGIIAGIGFPQIRNSYLRRTMGRRYTLNAAIRQLGLDRARIIKAFTDNGFQVTG